MALHCLFHVECSIRDKQIPKVKSFETNCAYIVYKTNPRVPNGFLTLLDASIRRKEITLSNTINQELMFNPLQGQLTEI
uniref:Uncharacterized protein n=1 Tax=Solanum lycopersicum TaxID=4081 RepID=A0A3Q7IJL3_SOLLC